MLFDLKRTWWNSKSFDLPINVRVETRAAFQADPSWIPQQLELRNIIACSKIRLLVGDVTKEIVGTEIKWNYSHTATSEEQLIDKQTTTD